MVAVRFFAARRRREINLSEQALFDFHQFEARECEIRAMAVEQRHQEEPRMACHRAQHMLAVADGTHHLVDLRCAAHGARRLAMGAHQLR